MTMTDREMIDAIFERLSQAPVGLDATNHQVLMAAGLLITGILRTAFADPVGEAEHFSQVLQLAVKTCRGAVARTH
jgi:hypothetical protein